MPKTVCQSVAWFKRYKTLKSVTVGSLNLRKFSYSARTRSAFGLARNKVLCYLCFKLSSYQNEKTTGRRDKNDKSDEFLLVNEGEIVPRFPSQPVISHRLCRMTFPRPCPQEWTTSSTTRPCSWGRGCCAPAPTPLTMRHRGVRPTPATAPSVSAGRVTAQSAVAS